MAYEVKEIKPGLMVLAGANNQEDLDNLIEMFEDLIGETLVVNLSDEEVELIIRLRYHRQGCTTPSDVRDLLDGVIGALKGFAPEGLVFCADDETGGYGYWPKEES